MPPRTIDAPQRAKGMVHHQIATTAKGLAREQWATLAKQNAFYKAFPDVEAYVAAKWPLYIDATRQLLAAMLGNPKYDEAMKSDIRDALLLDGAVNPKKLATPAKPSIFKD